MSAQFFGRSGKVLYGAFSIVGMAYQSQNVNNSIPDGRVARSTMAGAIMFDSAVESDGEHTFFSFVVKP